MSSTFFFSRCIYQGRIRHDCFFYSLGEAQTLKGAGATFPYPVYSSRAYQYSQVSGLKINHQSIVSGAGITQIKARTIDFGASDAPLTVGGMNYLDSHFEVVHSVFSKGEAW